MTTDNESRDPVLIYSYSRADALRDGTLVDAGGLPKEAGIKWPVALTQAAWQTCVTVPDAAPWQDEVGRLWDVLWILRHAIKSGKGDTELHFKVLVQNDTRPAKAVALKAVSGPGDDLEPVITVMLPDED